MEDGDGIPSWAKNQQKLFLRKENARSSVRDVDVKDLQGSVLENGARDGSEVERPKLELQGTVKARLAMWGKTVDEDALRLARRQEEEERKAEAERKAQLEREAAEKRKLIDAAIEKFANMTLSDVTKEPVKEIELVVYLERKIVLVNNEISRLETQLGDLQRSQ